MMRHNQVSSEHPPEYPGFVYQRELLIYINNSLLSNVINRKKIKNPKILTSHQVTPYGVLYFGGTKQ